MECEACREILSARLDGEDLPGEAAAADAHLAGCRPCARWWDDAGSVSRLARVAVLAEPPVSPRLSAPVLAAAAPGPGPRRAAVAMRWLLGLLGLAQFLLGIAQISVLSAGDQHHGTGVSAQHLWHESAAWNVAVGAGFGWIALRRVRPAGLVPVLAAFVVMLVLLSANDLGAGRVDGPRLLSHSFVVAGFALLLTLSRPRFDFGDPPAQRRRGPHAPTLGTGHGQPPPAPRLRLVTGGPTAMLRPERGSRAA